MAIEGISHEIDGGRFAAKAVAGQPERIEADIFSDGHDVIAAALVHRRCGARELAEVPMTFVVNDRWRATLSCDEPGDHEFGFLAWRDLYATWQKETDTKIAAGQPIALELEEGRRLFEAAAARRGVRTAPTRRASARPRTPTASRILCRTRWWR